MSVYIRRFIPAEGFFIDERIKELTEFGYYNDKVLYAPDDEQIANKIRVEREPEYGGDESDAVSLNKSDGIDLTDINAKEHKQVNTDYIYSNFDDSDESLEFVVKKGLDKNS